MANRTVLLPFVALVHILWLASYFHCNAFDINKKSTLFDNRSVSKIMSSKDDATAPADPLEQLGLPRPLLLGSASFTRKLICKEMGIDFHVLVRPIDEKGIGNRQTDPPEQLVRTLGKAKMGHLVQQINTGKCEQELAKVQRPPSTTKDNGWVVLTGDQVVTCNGVILEKPDSIEQARDFCQRYVDHPPSTVGSCVLTHVPSGITVSGVDTAMIHFNAQTLQQHANHLIDDLLAQDAPVLNCAGALMVEHPLVEQHIQRIEGTVDSVMGLSKPLVLRLLQELANRLLRQGRDNKES